MSWPLKSVNESLLLARGDTVAGYFGITGDFAMKAVPLFLVVGFLATAIPRVSAAEDTPPTSAEFQGHWGGLLTSNAFRIEADRPRVILPPASLRDGDQLLIRPQRLNSDEYLILQHCLDASCSKAEVVRAWNAYGYMGPYPVLTRTVQIKSGGPYLLWMQHVPGQGVGSFKLYDRDAPPLVFQPVGLRVAHNQKQLQEAQAQGPEDIKTSYASDATYVVTFDSGSTVRMQALRVPST
jgi:hypothetical protein